jgi:cell division transport system permease protein
MLVISAATDWQAAVGREVTIQVRPIPGRDIEADVRRAVEIASAAAGVAGVHAYTKRESARLVEPWLGHGLALDELPIPRLLVVKLLPGSRPDFTALSATLQAQVASASLDDHRHWIERVRTMASTALAAGGIVFVLVLAVTALSVAFATRGAMATNRPIIEVLHYVGATDAFITGQFQRHFLVLGLKGGIIGGGAGIALFGLLEMGNTWFAGTAPADRVAVLLGNLSIGVGGYLAIMLQILFMALITAFASRNTVSRLLATID